VDRLSGLRSDDQLTTESDKGTPPAAIAGARKRDASGRIWQELNLSALAGDERFLRIVA